MPSLARSAGITLASAAATCATVAAAAGVLHPAYTANATTFFDGVNGSMMPDVAPAPPSVSGFAGGAIALALSAASWSLIVVASIAALVATALATYAAVFVLPRVVTDDSARAAVFAAVSDTAAFYASLWHYLARDGSYPAPYFKDCTQARVQVHSLALVARMWSTAHYRSGTFQNDMAKNLRNVAIPGTGLPLSVLCHFKAVAYLFLLVGYPLAALASAVNLRRSDAGKMAAAYTEQLLTPQDWFSFWRLNCRLATLHASLTGDRGYDMEDKWKFLQTAEANGIAVSPTMKMPRIIVKHRNEEGGLGLHAFKNAAVNDGDWIIQEHLENDAFVASLLPADAPLSTFRVVSQSRAGLPSKAGAGKRAGAKEGVTALSCVFRAGREGAVTDHVSVLYDVDMATGVIGKGTTNQHWYQLGPDKVLTTPWNNAESTTVHPDTGREVTGVEVGAERMAAMMALVEDAHLKMCPNVPLVGWGVAFTNKGVLPLEGNLSCNFFRGSFDKEMYFEFVSDYFAHLDQTARAAEAR